MEVENETILNVDGVDIQWGRKQYRTPFKVQIYCWGPKDDLLALASKKGEITVKRLGWRKCWKITVGTIVDPLCNADPDTLRHVVSLCWNPRGDVLAVGMSDGHLHLIDVDAGALRLTRRIGESEDWSLEKLRWFCSQVTEVPKTVNRREYDIWDIDSSELSEEDITRNSSDVEQRSEDIVSILEIEALFENSLRETVMLALSDTKVAVVAAGLVVIAVIDLVESMGSLQLCPIVVYDICYSQKHDSVLAVITSTGPRPHCGGSGIFGVPVTIPGTSEGNHSHVVNFPLGETSFFISEHRWRIVSRVLRIYNRLRYLESLIANFTKEWDNKTQIFANRLKPPSASLNLGNALVAVLLAGVAGPNIEVWLERMIGQNISGLTDYAQQTVKELSKSLTAGLGIAIRSLSLQLDMLNMEIAYLHQMQIDVTWAESILCPPRNEDINVYPYKAHLSPQTAQVQSGQTNDFRKLSHLLEEMSTNLQQKQHECSLVGVNSMNEICTFVRWLTTFPHILRSRRSASLDIKMLCFDYDMLLKYILHSFLFVDSDKAFIERTSFQYDDIIKMLEATTIGSENLEQSNDVIMSQDGDQNMVLPQCHHKTRLDKISTYWSQNEIDRESILLLVDESAVDRVNKASLSSLIAETRRLFGQITNFLSKTIHITSPDWLYEMASDKNHHGYKIVQLNATSWSSSDTSRCIVPFQDIGVSDFYKAIGQHIGESFTVAWCSEQEAGSTTIVPKDIRAKDRLIVYSGPIEQMDIAAKSSPFNVSHKYKLRYESEKMDIRPGTLTIDTLQRPESNSCIKSVISFEPYADGYFVLLFNCTDQSNGETKKYFVGNSISRRWLVHDIALRTEPFESIKFSLNGERACGLVDGGTSVILWNTRPPTGGEEEEKTRKIELYRNEDVASAPNATRHISTNVLFPITQNN